MTDDIDAWIEASLENAGRPLYAMEGCPNCESTTFHGFARSNCPGSHVTLDPAKLEAIESQGILDWSDETIWLGND